MEFQASRASTNSSVTNPYDSCSTPARAAATAPFSCFMHTARQCDLAAACCCSVATATDCSTSFRPADPGLASLSIPTRRKTAPVPLQSRARVPSRLNLQTNQSID
jgi:hypothetical protein